MSFVLTLVADRERTRLARGLIDAVRDAVLGTGLEILSPGEAVEIACAVAPDPQRVAATIGALPVDAIATPARGRRKDILVADMDSTIVTTETLDELAGAVGLKERIAAITRRSMNGELDFGQALRERVAMLKGLPLAALERTWDATAFTPGAVELVATMRARGATCALVTGGFTFFSSRVAEELGFDVHRANTLVFEDGRLTGEVREPILDRDVKLQTLLALAARRGVPAAQALALGDGANDIPMLREAGLGIGFRPKPVVAEVIPARIQHAGLRAALFAQGYRAAEIVAG